jgi:chromate transporter
MGAGMCSEVIPAAPFTGARAVEPVRDEPGPRTPHDLGRLVRYFLRLGAFGFGGPIALSGAMQRDLVETRGWFTPRDYVQALALAQIAPGPLAAQLAIYLGWVRAGIVGATLVGLAFILPSFALVLGLSALYVHYHGLAWMQAAFYGIGPAVIAVIVRSAFKLSRITAARDPLLWGILAANALITAWTERELVWAVVLGGVVAAGRVWLRGPAVPPAMMMVGSVSPWLLQGLRGEVTWPTVARIAVYFGEAGLFVFGSGLAIVPFLHGGVVREFQWLTERQFLDAVAVAMITPGPVVITVAFIGYLVGGFAGAFAAALGVFVPCYLFVVLLAPTYRRNAESRWMKPIVSGVTAAAGGAIVGAAFVLGHRFVVDAPTLAIFGSVLTLMVTVRTLPEPVLVLGSGVVGLVIKQLVA